MNIFIVDWNHTICAQWHCDKHVVKMPLESTQMLSTVHHRYSADGPYLPVHQKHPCTLWAGKTRANYHFAFVLYKVMLFEYYSRYMKKHGASKHMKALEKGINFIPYGRMTKHPQCFSGHDELKTDEFYPIEAYRNFYRVDKSKFARYKYTERPKWFLN